jgi:hypothetical protein
MNTRRFSQPALVLAILKLIAGFCMLRIPQLGYDGEHFAWPMVGAGILLVIAGLHLTLITVRRGGDISLIMIVHRLSKMALLRPRVQWGLIAAVISAMSLAVFALFYSSDLRVVLAAAFVAALLVPVLMILIRISERMPLYVPGINQQAR